MLKRPKHQLQQNQSAWTGTVWKCVDGYKCVDWERPAALCLRGGSPPGTTYHQTITFTIPEKEVSLSSQSPTRAGRWESPWLGLFPVGLGQGELMAHWLIRSGLDWVSGWILELTTASSETCLSSALYAAFLWIDFLLRLHEWPHSSLLVERAPLPWQNPWTWLSLVPNREVSSLKEPLWPGR